MVKSEIYQVPTKHSLRHVLILALRRFLGEDAMHMSSVVCSVWGRNCVLWCAEEVAEKYEGVGQVWQKAIPKERQVCRGPVGLVRNAKWQTQDTAVEINLGNEGYIVMRWRFGLAYIYLHRFIRVSPSNIVCYTFPLVVYFPFCYSRLRKCNFAFYQQNSFDIVRSLKLEKLHPIRNLLRNVLLIDNVVLDKLEEKNRQHHNE